MADFFISYTVADRVWAEWIAWVLEEEGRYSVIIQDWDFRPGNNFPAEMQRAMGDSERTIVVLSPNYLSSLWGIPEWAAALQDDPGGAKRKLIPVQIEETASKGVFSTIVHIDLVGLPVAKARETLIKGVMPGRAKPESVRFPGEYLFPGRAAEPSDLASAQAALAALPLHDVPKPGPLPVGSHMPLPLNPLFVGREEDLKAIARHLKAGDTIAVTGIGGVGKTQLASEFVYRYGRYFAGGVFWMSFADADAIPAEIGKCGQGLGFLSFEDSGPVQQSRLEGAWQSSLPRLLIFDNCEEEALILRWGSSFGAGARIFVTSRRVEWGRGLGVKTFQLKGLRRSESIKLLRRFRPDTPLPESSLEQIADIMSDLPMALCLAEKFIRQYSNDSFDQLATYLESLRQKKLREHSYLQEHNSGPSPTKLSNLLGHTFDLILERLENINRAGAAAIRLLARAAWFAPGKPISRTLLLTTDGVSTGDKEETEKALQQLTDLGLLEADEQDDLLMHHLVAVWARGMTKSDQAQAAVEWTILVELSRWNERRTPERILAWQPHLRTITDRALQREDLMAARLCNELGAHLGQAGDYLGARPYLQNAISLHSVISGMEHLETAKSLNNLGYLLHQQGDYPTARLYYEQSLSIRERVLGPEHRETAGSLNNLGSLFRDQGDFEKARQCFERVLAITERSFGLEHPETANTLNNLGILLRAQGDFSGARQSFERALAIQEKVLEPEHPDTAATLNNLAILLQYLGDFEGARPYGERAVAIRENVLGPEHPNTAKSLLSLGSVDFKQGNFDRARSYLERALSVFQARLGPDHPSTKDAQIRLVRCQQSMALQG